MITVVGHKFVSSSGEGHGLISLVVDQIAKSGPTGLTGEEVALVGVDIYAGRTAVGGIGIFLCTVGNGMTVRSRFVRGLISIVVKRSLVVFQIRSGHVVHLDFVEIKTEDTR